MLRWHVGPGRLTAPTYDKPANNSTKATRKIPPRPPNGKMTASTPPSTHTSWNRVSKRANARPLAASAPSRCKRLSNARRPVADADAIATAATMSASRPYQRAANTNGMAGLTSAPARIHSSRTRRRRSGASTVPIAVPIALIRRTRPYIHAGSWRVLSTNAAKNVKNPTAPRIRPMAVPAVRMLRAWRASRSSAVSARATFSACGRPSAARSPSRKINDAVRSTQGVCANRRMSAATGPAAIPPRMLMNARRELASTNSPLFLITLGTSALFVTLCVFESTSAPNASGYSAKPLTCAAMIRHNTARAAIVAANTRRRPPRVRSRSGPNTGATTANGASVSMRYSSTLGRAWLLVALKNSVSGERHGDEHVARDADRISERKPRNGERRRLESGPCVRDHKLPAGVTVRGRDRTPRPLLGAGNHYRAPSRPAYHSNMHPGADNPEAGSPRYLDRELSWLEFNARVLALAENAALPLLERAKFLAIFSSNLDEFFQVRVSGLKEQLEAGIRPTSQQGIDQVEQLTAIRTRVEELVTLQAAVFTKDVLPALQEAGVEFCDWSDLDETERTQLTREFDDRIFPVLTPLAVDPAHPFPYISSLSLNLAVVVRDASTGEQRFARVKVPPLLPRFVAVPASSRFVALEQVIAAHLDALFPGMEVLEHYAFRVTRDADFELSDDAEDLLAAMEFVLRQRTKFGAAVRLEVDARHDSRSAPTLAAGSSSSHRATPT